MFTLTGTWLCPLTKSPLLLRAAVAPPTSTCYHHPGCRHCECQVCNVQPQPHMAGLPSWGRHTVPHGECFCPRLWTATRGSLFPSLRNENECSIGCAQLPSVLLTAVTSTPSYSYPEPRSLISHATANSHPTLSYPAPRPSMDISLWKLLTIRLPLTFRVYDKLLYCYTCHIELHISHLLTSLDRGYIHQGYCRQLHSRIHGSGYYLVSDSIITNNTE